MPRRFYSPDEKADALQTLNRFAGDVVPLDTQDLGMAILAAAALYQNCRISSRATRR